MRVPVRLLLCLAGFVASCGSGSDAPAGFKPAPEIARAAVPSIDLVGKVVNAAGEAIAGAELRVLSRWRSATTDAEGRWSLRLGPPQGQVVEIFAYADGYTVTRTTVALPRTLQEGRELSSHIRMPEANTLQGHYRDVQGRPVVGARLSLRCLTPSLSVQERQSWNAVLSDPAGFDLTEVLTGSGEQAGAFSWTGLPDGLYEVFAMADSEDAAEQVLTGAELAQSEEAVAATHAELRSGQLVGADSLTLTRGKGVFDLIGKVFDHDAGFVAGARLVAERLDGSGWASATSDGLGGFRFPGLTGDASAWSLSAEADGLVSERTGSLLSSEAALTLAKARTVRFRLRDALGKPVAGVSLLSLGTSGGVAVPAAHSQLSVQSDRNGLLTLTGLPEAEGVILQIWSPWRCTPHELRLDLRRSSPSADEVVDLALPGDHSSPRFPVPIQFAESAAGWGGQTLTLTAYSEERAIVGELQVRALPGSPAHPPRYAVSFGGAPGSVHARTAETVAPVVEAMLPVGSLLLRARLDDRIVAMAEVDVKSPFGPDASPREPVQLIVDARD